MPPAPEGPGAGGPPAGPPGTAGDGGGSAMVAVLGRFVGELRAAGIPVSMTEHLDAAEVLRHIPLEDRPALKSALGAALVKSSAHWRAYETAFEVYFALRGDGYAIDGEADGEPGSGEDAEGRAAGAGDGGRMGRGRGSAGGGGQGMTAEELAAMLMNALTSGDEAMMAAVARQAVARYAGMEPGRPVGGTYYLYRTLRNLDLDAVLEQLVDGRRSGDRGGQDGAEGGGGDTPQAALTPLEERLARDEFRARIDLLRRQIEDEIRRRLVADRGSEALAKSVRKPLPEDIDVMHATRDELVALRRALQPLSRKLAVRLARKRRHGRRGPLDFRSTVRHSLSTGGVPVEPRFRYPRPAKPEIVVIADISGSVASFARFTLHLVHAISAQFSKVRSFVFIDGIDEVTRFFEHAEDPAEAVHRINTEADVVWVDGHSDYGHALTVFLERWGDELTPRTSVLLLGDARNNYHASQAWVVGELARRSRHVYWLNPEPRAYWNSGDSIVGEYGAHCEDVVECRTLRQLERFVGELA
ncbi:MAG: VWA domain-containing protein [Actinomycetota bacterium]|nr:VWA domain-containing protein [Actinomycetota bacterium]